MLGNGKMITEFRIRRVLRRLAKQRVAMIHQPGNVWVIEKAVKKISETDAILSTCYMRGWVEPIVDALPKGKLTPERTLPDGDIFDEVGPLYRLTDSGWSVINRSHQWLMMSIFVAVLASSSVGEWQRTNSALVRCGNHA